MFLKDISIFSSGGHFVQQIGSLCNFGRGHYEKHFCEIILNLDPWFRRCCIKLFLINSLGGNFLQQSRTICAIW